MSAIFRQLTAGIKFDKRKYRQEAEKFGLVKKCENEEQNENLEKTVSLTLEDDFVPDSNLPTPDDSGEENSELQLLGKDYQSTYMFLPHESQRSFFRRTSTLACFVCFTSQLL